MLQVKNTGRFAKAEKTTKLIAYLINQYTATSQMACVFAISAMSCSA